MGYPIVRYTCSGCGREEGCFRSRKPRYYAMGTGRHIVMNWCVGWCYSCDGLSEVEDTSLDDHLATLRRVSESLASATSRKRWISEDWYCTSFHPLDVGLSTPHRVRTEHFHEMAKTLEEVGEQIEYLVTRTAPPRCLRCSGHQVEKLTPQANGKSRGWLHPGCGGIFEMEIKGSLNVIPSETKLIYKPDGMFSHEEPRLPSTEYR